MSRIKQDVDHNLSERLGYLIQFAGLSQKDFADLIRKTPRTVSAWLTNKTPITSGVLIRALCDLKKYHVECSESWLLKGEGAGPILLDKDQINQIDIFSHFSSDYTFSTLTSFFRQTYADVMHLFVSDETYAPIIKPNTLLIAVGVTQDHFINNWDNGYLYKRSEQRIFPIYITKDSDHLIAKPFDVQGFDSLSFALPEDMTLYPIINTRVVYESYQQ